MNDFTYGHTVSAGEFISMREAVGWYGLSERQAEAGIRNAAYVIGVRNADGNTWEWHASSGMADCCLHRGCHRFARVSGAWHREKHGADNPWVHTGGTCGKESR